MRKNPAYEGQSVPINAQLRLEDNPAYEKNVVTEEYPAYGQGTALGTGEQKHANDICGSEYELVVYSGRCQELETSMLNIHDYEIPDAEQTDATVTEGKKTMETPSGCDVQLEQST